MSVGCCAGKRLLAFFASHLALVYSIGCALMEPAALRRKVITAAGLSGLFAAMFLLASMVANPVTARITGQHIAYDFSHSYVWAATVLYLLGTCVSPLLSSFGSVRLFGLVAITSAMVTFVLFETWFISVWCYFAGWMSCVVLLHFYPEVRNRIRRVWASQRV